jgi:hypothetical protein
MRQQGINMGRLLKYLVYLVVLAFGGLVVYSYLGDISAPQSEVTQTIEIDGT